jgi:hypothetical protein
MANELLATKKRDAVSLFNYLRVSIERDKWQTAAAQDAFVGESAVVAAAAAAVAAAAAGKDAVETADESTSAACPGAANA